jgi:hypothetical protein
MRTLVISLSLAMLFLPAVFAQLPPPRFLINQNPTSAERVVAYVQSRTCGNAYAYTGNPYSVAQKDGRITVTLGKQRDSLVGTCPISEEGPLEYIDLGVLPAGNYTFTLIGFAPGKDVPIEQISAAPFTVTDARKAKVAPYVRLDYSGTWWDPNDPGWGLFVWQNVTSPRDELFAAWFTFGPDGKPVWYTFQPTWRNAVATSDGELTQSSRPPSNAASPPPGQNELAKVGTASLNFVVVDANGVLYPDSATLSYTIGSGPKRTRVIQRFKP